MREATVRIYASHPVVGDQYVRVLSSHDDIRIVKDDVEAEVGIFDGATVGLDALITLVHLRCPLLKPLLISSVSEENECLALTLRGVCGIVSYDCYEDVMYRAVRALAEGQLWLPSSLVLRKLRMDNNGAFLSESSGLTQREQEILGLIMRRLSNKEIACILGITVRTVKFHVGNIFTKLHVSDRKKLVTTLSQQMKGPVLPVPQPVP